MAIFGLFKNKKDQEKDDSTNQTNVSAAPANPDVAEIAQTAEDNILPASWIPISDDGEFICSECNNKVAPETNTEEGTVTADLAKIKSDLEQYPTKVIYGICPICGMEFTFKLAEGKLHLEPSDMMK